MNIVANFFETVPVRLGFKKNLILLKSQIIMIFIDPNHPIINAQKIHRQSSYSIFLVVCLERCNFLIYLLLRSVFKYYDNPTPTTQSNTSIMFTFWHLDVLP